MSNFAVIAVSGKQYLVKQGDSIVVDKVEGELAQELKFDSLASFSDDAKTVEVGMPALTSKITAKIVEQGKGQKIRVAKFKSKVRYRNVRGFRPTLTKLEIISLG